MRPRISLWTVLFALVVGALRLPLAHAATDKERAAARALAGDGARAFQAKDYESAVDLFTRAEALIHSPVHLLFLARSHRALGQLVKAREAYIKITRERLEPGAPKVFFDAQRDAGTELEEVEPRLASLTVAIEGVAPEAARLTLDGETVPSVLLGVPMPMDPGSHELVATAVGAEEKSQSITLAEGQKESIRFELVVTHPPEESASQPPGPDQPPPPPPKEGRSHTLQIVGWTGIGLGTLGLGYAGYLSLEATAMEEGAGDDFDACTPNCTDEEASSITNRDNRAASRKTDAAVLAGVSGGVLLTGLVLVLVDAASDDTAGLTPWVGWRSAGLSGRF